METESGGLYRVNTEVPKPFLLLSTTLPLPLAEISEGWSKEGILEEVEFELSPKRWSRVR